MSARAIVTLHAIRRFAERVLGVRGLPDDDAAALVALRSVHGVDTVEIERELSAFVQVGATMGASAVLYRGARYVLSERTLVTVLDTPKRRRQRGRIDRDED